MCGCRSFGTSKKRRKAKPRGGQVLDEKKRNDALKIIQCFGEDEEARQRWKKLCGYHRRSLAETAMYRFKRSFGGNFRSRKLAY
ncbi:hypothetical protein NEOC65_001481 [Neochlamydia sp. AcF65]|nr:hypothetical protein [Neochlamydia sp. AcF65]MBS4169349.1 hypothetical protein [Neochlamydia sp. AcF95]